MTGRRPPKALVEPGAPGTPLEDDELLVVEDLSVHFPVGHTTLPAVDGVSMRIRRGQIVGLVGESGSGKSTLGLALLRMVPAPGKVTSGRVRFAGQDILSIPEQRMRALRGAAISLVVQDALAVMNPVTMVSEQMAEVLHDHTKTDKASIRKQCTEMLRRVHLTQVDRVLARFPHQLSGGMQQRVVIAESLLLSPSLMVADEPTTALDVTVQAHVLDLLRELRASFGMSILFVTHDLATVGELCDFVLVMYAGRIVEAGTVQEVFSEPLHPYTRSLFAGLLPLHEEPPETLSPLPGQPPRAGEWPTGCRFNPRCALKEQLGHPAICEESEPEAGQDEHWAACHFAHAPTRAVG